MKENAKKLKCGNCGESSFNLFVSDKEDITAECNECKSTTVINIKARINFDWGEDSNGILAVF